MFSSHTWPIKRTWYSHLSWQTGNAVKPGKAHNIFGSHIFLSRGISNVMPSTFFSAIISKCSVDTIRLSHNLYGGFKILCLTLHSAHCPSSPQKSGIPQGTDVVCTEKSCFRLTVQWYSLHTKVRQLCLHFYLSLCTVEEPQQLWGQCGVSVPHFNSQF